MPTPPKSPPEEPKGLSEVHQRARELELGIEPTCKNCRFLTPTGEDQHGWCEKQNYPQLLYGICGKWAFGWI